MTAIDSGPSSFPREKARTPGHLETKSWPQTHGAWLCFCPSLRMPSLEMAAGTLVLAACGGRPVASAGWGQGL